MSGVTQVECIKTCLGFFERNLHFAGLQNLVGVIGREPESHTAVHDVFAQPECGLGIIPGFGGTQRLARLVGKGRAKELIFTCDRIDAQEAYRIGLVNKVVPQAELMDACMTMAEKLLSKSSYAISMAKACIETGMDTDLSSGLDLEATSIALTFSTHDKAEGMAAFLERRPANLTDF